MSKNYNSTLQSNNTDLQEILSTINNLPTTGGATLPTLTNEGDASDLLSGKQLIDGDGEVVTGTFTIDSELSTQDSLIAQIQSAVNSLPEAGGEQATPVISVNSTNGLITATAGSKTSTYQLAFQAAKTITPGTTNQTAVSSGYYTGGAVTVKGDSNLVAGNIKSGVSIFGVNGNYAGSGDTSMEDGLITRTLTSYTNDRVTNISSYVFYSCSNLKTVSFPKVITIGSSAFLNCNNLTAIDFPAVYSISFYGLAGCSKLTTVNFPAAKYFGRGVFQGCVNLTTASFPVVSNIGHSVFSGCYNLKSLYLTGSSVCTLSASNAFSSTPIGGYSTSAGTYGRIYVPASLLASYKAATNWTYFSSRFVGI